MTTTIRYYDSADESASDEWDEIDFPAGVFEAMESAGTYDATRDLWIAARADQLRMGWTERRAETLAERRHEAAESRALRAYETGEP